jgi:hypothetical protein
MTSNSLGGMRRVSAAVLMLLTSGELPAQGSDRTIGQFVHTGWTAKDGVIS